MTTMADFAKKLDKFNMRKATGDILSKNEEKLKDMNIEQLMQGKNSEGKPLSPKYSEDPYFKSREAALNYARWKKRLFPQTPFDTPNLIIVGRFHSSVFVRRSGDQLQFGATVAFAGSVASKYGEKELGLSPENKGKVWSDIVKNPLVEEFCRQTGAKAG